MNKLKVQRSLVSCSKAPGITLIFSHLCHRNYLMAVYSVKKNLIIPYRSLEGFQLFIIIFWATHTRNLEIALFIPTLYL